MAMSTLGSSGTSLVESMVGGKDTLYCFQMTVYLSKVDFMMFSRQKKGGENHRLCLRHVTDVTNASRTMLMDIESLKWSQELRQFFQLPTGIHLPKIQVALALIFPLVLLSGVLWPSISMPVWLQWLATCLPLTDATAVTTSLILRGSANYIWVVRYRNIDKVLIS